MSHSSLSKVLAGTPLDPTAVSRAALVNRLRAARTQPAITIFAPAGYGKTTLLAQWAAREERVFAWVSVEEAHNAPLELLRSLAGALRAAGAIDDGAVADVVRPHYGSDWMAALARVSTLWSVVRSPVVVVFDDVHRLGPESGLALGVLIRLVREGSTIVLSGRHAPAIPELAIPRLRACGQLVELGPADLALTRRETRSLLRAGGISMPDAELTELLERTEGWAAGVQLAARVRTPDDLCAQVRRRYLLELSPTERAFLRRTSVLETMSGPLCDAVLRREGSTRELEHLAEANLFVVRLDRRREWFRHHHLFRELLQAELEELEPAVVPVLHERAADWFEANDMPEHAVEHAAAVGDTDRFLQLFAESALPVHNNGGADLAGWLTQVVRTERLERSAEAAALAARLHAHHGRPAEVERCLLAAEAGLKAASGGEGLVAAKVSLARAATCATGVERMLAAAESALDELPADDRWRPYALLLQGTAYALLGEHLRGNAILSRATRSAERLGATETRVLALTERGLIAHGRDELERAEQLLADARAIGAEHLAGYPVYGLTLAACGRMLLRRGRWAEARTTLAEARPLVVRITGSLPWLAVQARLELASAYVMLRDREAALELHRESAELLSARADLGVLPRQHDELGVEIALIPEPATGGSRLTRAEFRLLPLLATHLSFGEIGTYLCLSRHTVKTQAISIYRKLGVSSRRDAVRHAERLGLVMHRDLAPISR